MSARRRTVSAAALLGLTLWSGPALAAANDHLACYRVGDANEASASVDLTTLPFGVDSGCTVEAKARELCIPATGEVLVGGPNDADPVPASEIAQERLCYRIDCPRRALPPVVATDRFGARRVALRRPRMFCTPVSLEAPAP
jgi:hypothetical protein